MIPSQLPDVGNRLVAFDTETSGLHPDDLVIPVPDTGSPCCRVSTVSVAYLDDDDQLVAVAFPFDQGLLDKVWQPSLFETGGNDPNLPETEWRALCDWLKKQRLTAHNYKFDTHMMMAGTRHWSGVDLTDNAAWDTSLGEKLIHPTESGSLENSIKRRPHLVSDKKVLQGGILRSVRALKIAGVGVQDNPRYDLAAWDVMEPYAIGDAKDALLLAFDQQRTFQWGEAAYHRFWWQMELMQGLCRIERRGLPFDAEGCLALAQQVRREIAAIAATLPFEPTLPGAKRYYFETLGYSPIKTTEKRGDPQLDDEVRDKLIQRGAPHIKDYDHLIRLENACNRWYEGWPTRIGEDGRLRTVFRQSTVRTGRMSVERVQLHAVPKDGTLAEGIYPVRKFFKPKPGFALWNCDLSQAELRAAAKEAKCKLMLELLAGGGDMHGVTTRNIFGIDKSHPEWKAKRDIGKRLTFGGIFLIGPARYQATLAKDAGIDLPLEECERQVYAWRDLYPEYKAAYYRWMKIAEKQNWIYLVGGEPSYFGPRDYYNSAWSRHIQASLASFMVKWTCATERHCPDTLLLTVHDSQALELPLCSESEMVPWGEGDDETLIHPIAAKVATWGQEGATRMFSTPMRVDVGPWREGYPLTIEEAKAA